jgi:hypothetical protein
MKCPSANEWDLLAIEALDRDQAEPLLAHARECPACRPLLETARREHIDRVRMYEAFDRNHDELREQLLAALPGELPAPIRAGRIARQCYRLGDYIMSLNTSLNRRVAAALVPAACLVIAVIMFFTPGKQVAFAAVIERMRQASTITSRLQIFMGDSAEPMQTGEFYIAEGRGSRVEIGAGVGPGMTMWSQPDGTSVMLQPALKTVVYMRAANPADVEAQGNSPDAYIRRLLELTGDADRQLGHAVKDGHEVEGFEVSAARMGIGALGSARSATADGTAQPVARIWVDLKARLPVLMEFETVEPTLGQHVRIQFDNFEWDVPLSADLFKPQITDDLRTIDVTIPPCTEQTLLDGLRQYADALGRFPIVLDPARVGAELALALVRKGKMDPTNPLSKELMDGSLTIAQACAFCVKLTQDGRNPEYFGDSVSPDDAGEILLRWRLADGQMRAIYGDLHAETLPATP